MTVRRRLAATKEVGACVAEHPDIKSQYGEIPKVRSAFPDVSALDCREVLQLPRLGSKPENGPMPVAPPDAAM